MNSVMRTILVLTAWLCAQPAGRVSGKIEDFPKGEDLQSDRMPATTCLPQLNQGCNDVGCGPISNPIGNSMIDLFVQINITFYWKESKTPS